MSHNDKKRNLSNIILLQSGPTTTTINIRKRGEKQKVSFILQDYKQWTTNMYKHDCTSSSNHAGLYYYLQFFINIKPHTM